MTRLYELVGARRIALVGRAKILREILDRYERLFKPTIWYLEGIGGIGKTAVLNELHRIVNEDTYLGTVTGIIDLYHVAYQTPLGLFRRLLQELHTVHTPSSFAEARYRLDETERYYQQHKADEAREAWAKAVKALIQGINALAKKNGPLLILLDTVEVLAILAKLEENKDERKERDAGYWLFRQILPHLTGKIMIVAAGRPTSDQTIRTYLNRLKKGVGAWQIVMPDDPLPPLNEDESQKYLRTVAVQLEAGNDKIGARRLERYLEQYGGYLYQGTKGRPLRLALVADILRVNGVLPAFFYGKSSIPGDAADDDLDKALVEHFRKLQTPLGEILYVLGYLQKGGDQALIAELLGAKPDDPVFQEAVAQLERLTLVKYRPGGAGTFPYFLHDEIYRLFARFFPVPAESRQERYSVIAARYKQEQITLQEKIKSEPASWAEMAQRRRVLDVELVHYAVWANLWRGFAEYYKQMLVAAEIRDPVPRLLLRHEMQRTLDALKDAQWTIPPALDTYIRWCDRLRGIERQILLEGQYERAAQSLDVWEKESRPAFSQVDWAYVQAVLAIKQNQLDRAEQLLDQAEKLLKQTTNQPERLPDTPEDEPPCTNCLKLANNSLLAWLKNYQGYIARLRGQYAKAIEPYQVAAMLMRQHELKGLSGVLINQAYALIMMGRQKNARRTITEALASARHQQHVRDEIRALNIYAVVETRSGNFEKGQKYGFQALTLLQFDSDEFLEAHTRINLARASRYLWNDDVTQSVGELWRTSWKVRLLPALAQLEGAEIVREFFDSDFLDFPDTEHTAPEVGVIQTAPAPNLQIEAYIEAGCVWRELAWAQRKINFSVHKLFGNERVDKAEERLQLAAFGRQAAPDDWETLVQERIRDAGGSPYWPALALANLGWHYHYQRKYLDRIPLICNLIEQIIGDTYLWTDEAPPKIYEESGNTQAEVLRWAVLGKMEMLRAHEALRRRHDPDCLVSDECIKTAAKHALYALEYNYLIGGSAYDLERAENGLVHRLQANPAWVTELLPMFYAGAIETQDKIKRPTKHETKDTRLVLLLKETIGPPELLGINQERKGA